VCGVVPTEGVYALAVEEWTDVAADLVDIVGLLVCYDVQKHRLETDKGALGLVDWFLFDGRHNWPCVPQYSVAEVCHVLG
jgi:hypothetical protein